MSTTDYASYLSEHLSLNGLGAVIDANVDGSVTPQLFKVSHPGVSGFTAISRMIVTIRDNGVFAAEKYGAINELANGVQVGLWDAGDALVSDFTGGVNVKSNVMYGQFCYDVELKDWGPGDNFIVARWTFTLAGTTPILTPESGLSLGVRIQDDLSSLVGHYFMVQGSRRI